jgi:type I restriction enzyme S subunit
MNRHGWLRKSVSELCDFSSGFGFSPSDWSKEGLPIIRIQNLNGSRDFNYFAGKPEAEWLVPPGELLFAWAGTRGVSFGPTVWKGPLGVLNQHIYRVHPKPGVNKEWLYLVLRLVTGRIEAKAHGFKSTLVHVRKSDIDNQLVFMPDAEEQKRIVDTLRCWEDAILHLARKIELALKRKRWFMQKLLTGRKRFQEFVESPKYLQTHFGPFPEDWRVLHIGDMADEVANKNRSGHELPVLSCTKHRGLVDSLEYFGRRIFSENTSTYKMVNRGDFAYATNHIEEGSIGYQNLHDAALISPMYTVFRTRAGVDPSFFFKLLKTELYRHIFEANTNGTINRRGALRWDDFARIKVHLPGEPEQRRIAAVLETAYREIELLQKQLDALKEQKRALMQKLLTGDIRLKLPKGDRA